MIKILTDSTADLNPKYVKENGITVVPLNVNFQDKQYQDGVDLTNEEFYKMLSESAKLPTTSQPSPEKFLAHFEQAKQDGDTVICILISAGLSGTCQSANIAKEEAEYDNIYIVDSKSATLAEGLLVKRAVELLGEGKSAQEIVDSIEEAKERLHLLAIVTDLTNLRKGGRLSGVAAIAGGVLGIKPVVGINGAKSGKESNGHGHDGKLTLVGKARGMPGAYVNVFKLISELGGVEESEHVAVGYAGNRIMAEPFIKYMSQNLHLQMPDIGEIGAVIGTHAGEGACGVAFFSKSK